MLNALINQHLGRYNITALLGRGGMAAVYRAHDAALHRDITIKVLYPQYVANKTLVERFKREAITAAGLDHPNVIPIYDVGEEQGVVFIAMKLFPGLSFQDVLNEWGMVCLEELLPVLEQVASALDYAHAQNIVQRFWAGIHWHSRYGSSLRCAALDLYGVRQEFTQGLVLFTSTYTTFGKTIFVLYADGTFVRYNDT